MIAHFFSKPIVGFDFIDVTGYIQLVKNFIFNTFNLKISMKKLASVIALTLGSLVAATAQAESTFVTGTGSAAADLKFKIVIPRVLFLGVGTGAATLATNTAKDTLTFDYTNNASAVGTGVAAASITNDGAFVGSVVPVKVFGNGGQITLTTSNPVNLTSGTDTIPFTQITATSSDPVNLAVPALTGGTSAPVISTGTKVTNRTANWTFAYANTVAAPVGTYTGTVTYTASMP